MDGVPIPEVTLDLLDLQNSGHLGIGGKTTKQLGARQEFLPVHHLAAANIKLLEGQVVTFILRCPPKDPPIPQAIPKMATADEFHVSFECMS